MSVLTTRVATRFMLAALLLLSTLAGTATGASAQNTVAAGAPSGTITLANPNVTVPVVISRSSGSPAVFAFSVVFRANSPLALTGSPASSITLPPGGGFLNADGGRSVSLQTLDQGGGVYKADGVTLGLPCGSSALSGTLFNIALTSSALGGSPAVEILSVTLRDCSNTPIAATVGASSNVIINRSAPEVTVVSPNGGETLAIGSTHNVTWTASDPEGVVGVDLAYSLDGGATYPFPIAAGIPNSGSHSWLVPNAPSSTVRVRVTASDSDANTTADASDADFSIACPTITVTPATTHVACFGASTGAIDISVSGGTAPYGYLWSNGATTQDLSGLAAGSYSVTVTDANGCTGGANVTITQPLAALALSSSQVNVACFGGATGSIDLSVSGGTAPYSYLWSNGATTQDLAGLVAGPYSVTVTDANGCIAGLPLTITQPLAALALSSSQVNVACFGGATGSIDLSVSGGTAPYSYLWSNGATTQDLAGLVAGPYSVTVTDANGCIAGLPLTITQPLAALALSSSQVNVACFGGATGSIDLSVSGGTAPYSYLWSNGATTQDLAGLVAGPYSVTVTDANGCIAGLPLTITQPTQLLVGTTHTDACLSSADGTIDVTASGGTPPYSYAWGDGPIDEDRSGLAPGGYSVVVTDANGCTAGANVTIGLRSYTIAASAGPNGTIAPDGSVAVTCGADQAFVVTPAPGYHVLDVVVDGGSQGPQSGWTFTNVVTNHTIAVTFEINPPVAAVANLVATQVRTGNPAGDVTRIALTWDPVPLGQTVEVWRAPYGHYPRYDEDGGSAPAVALAYPPAGPWVLTGVSASGGLDLPATRDFYYYVAYSLDGYGTWSPASNRTAGTLNYHLGDVSNGFTAGVGDNEVTGLDISLLGAHYGQSGGALSSFRYLDVGPTSTGFIDGRPLTDDAADFEDLVMYALNYGTVSAPEPILERGGASPAAADELRLDAPSAVTPGSTVAARLRLAGTGVLRAVSVRLSWDAAVVEPLDLLAGDWLALQNGVAFAPAPGIVDAAVLASTGMTGQGELATVNFRVIAAGDPRIRITSVDGRDERNQGVTVLGAQPIAVPAAAPRITQLAPARPNPFAQTASITFTLAAAGPVQLTVYAVDGRRVRTLASDVREAGEYSLVWDGRDEDGVAASTGVYFVQLVTGQGRFVRSATYLR